MFRNKLKLHLYSLNRKLTEGIVSMKGDNMFCEKCGKELPEGSEFCSSCGAKIGSGSINTEYSSSEGVLKSAKEFGHMATDAATAFKTNVTGDIAEDNEERIDIHFRDLFSGVFRKHSEEEGEMLFICGTSTTTPKIEDVTKEWPKPWLFSRIFLYLLAATLLLYFIIFMMGNNKAIPGYMFISAMMVPVAVMVFFFEVNIPRNISIFRVVKVFVIGGILSLIVTLLIGNFIYRDFNLIGSIGIGIAEETGKAIIIAAFLNRKDEHHYILNGLLIGAAVGAGFAAFESAGYIFNGFAQGIMNEVVIGRSLFAIGGHVIWCPITGAAMCVAAGGNAISSKNLMTSSFLGAFIIPVLLHAAWDWQFLSNMFFIKDPALIVIAWIVALAYIRRGIKEVNRLSAEAYTSSHRTEE